MVEPRVGFIKKRMETTLQYVLTFDMGHNMFSSKYIITYKTCMSTLKANSRQKMLTSTLKEVQNEKKGSSLKLEITIINISETIQALQLFHFKVCIAVVVVRREIIIESMHNKRY